MSLNSTNSVGSVSQTPMDARGTTLAFSSASLVDLGLTMGQILTATLPSGVKIQLAVVSAIHAGKALLGKSGVVFALTVQDADNFNQETMITLDNNGKSTSLTKIAFDGSIGESYDTWSYGANTAGAQIAIYYYYDAYQYSLSGYYGTGYYF